VWNMATDMESEDGRLWIYDTGDQQTVAFTHASPTYRPAPITTGPTIGSEIVMIAWVAS